MNQPPNPYAPPKFEAGADARYYGSAEGLRREGDAVVILRHPGEFVPSADLDAQFARLTEDGRHAA